MVNFPPYDKKTSANTDVSIDNKMKNFTITIKMYPYIFARYTTNYSLPMTTEYIKSKYLDYLTNPEKYKLLEKENPPTVSISDYFFRVAVKWEYICDLATSELEQLTINYQKYNFRNNNDFIRQVRSLLLLLEVSV